ncbi:MAG: acetyl-CoA acyltransferase [Bdellovibrionales bacterium RIFCSPHIGHO2_01_FULL_40_29]|nr:MAG: acetyl-CoA acyltransferase [Bdellovibrionales bacterium RIFCSPHIGHO2_01_FULL_40_29]OFZ34207.1 MAG: acetyl-CoA acyltransferase [Bdellovibrionales bacterium RIFCSPHIGHO2_02_FULL_40_15]
MSSLPKNARDVVIVDGVRTPFAKAGTKLKTVHAAQLGQVALKELIARTNLNVNLVDEVILGNTGSPSDAVNIARVVALNSGFPLSTSAVTVHRNCASAMESISSGFERIRSGTMDIIVAGGTENMSQMPFIMPPAITSIIERLGSARSGGAKISALWDWLMADLKQIKEMATTAPLAKTKYKPIIALAEGLTDPFVGMNMGMTAEVIAKEFGITRRQQDEYALLSHQKATAAKSKIKEEMTPLYLPPDFKETITEDIGPRDNQTLEALQKLKPFFDKVTGTITAGNSCPITDGAAMVLLMAREKAEALGYKPVARIRGYGYVGLEPERMGMGPAYSTPLALKRAGLTMKDIGRVELNEAFAAQVLACQKAFESDEFGKKLGLAGRIGELRSDILNVNGGAIAYGHPVGATGSRITLTLMKEMQRSQIQFGLATLCIGGGQGGTIILENEG